MVKKHSFNTPQTTSRKICSVSQEGTRGGMYGNF